MNKKIAIIIFSFLLVSSAQAADWLDSFRINLPKKTCIYTPSKIKLLEKQEYEEPSTEVYNEAVALNNQAIEKMDSNRFDEACKLFKQAIALNPGKIGFRKNYLIALKKANKTKEYLDQSLIVLSEDPEDTSLAYNIGVTYLNDFKEYEKAADYFSYVLEIKPNDSYSCIALINSLEKTKKYKDSVFALLKKYSDTANDAYLFYLLGSNYLDKENYTQAMKAFAKGKKLEGKTGYNHYSYNKAAFYRGNLNGLEKSIKQTLNKFPDDPNYKSLEALYKNIKDKEIEFQENVKLEIEGASSLIELKFNVRPIKDFYGHQKVKLISTELFSKGKMLKVTPKTEEDGSLTIDIPKSMWSRKIDLNFKYNIELKALFGAYYTDGEIPDINKLKSDEKLSLNDERLTELVRYIDNYSLEDQEGIDNPDELFAIKASTIVSKGLKYQINRIDNSVSWALDHINSCDCTEYSKLLIALCLKKGIPARQVSGYLVKTDDNSEETNLGHSWCEVYIDGRGWTFFDPTCQATMYRSCCKNLLNAQIVFEHPLDFDTPRISLKYVASEKVIKLSLNDFYKITNW